MSEEFLKNTPELRPGAHLMVTKKGTSRTEPLACLIGLSLLLSACAPTSAFDPAWYEPRNVSIAPTNQSSERSGTCFAVTPSGLLLTAHHVVVDADSIAVTLADGRTESASTLQQAEANDLALLRIETPTPNYLPLAADHAAEVGDRVFTLGFPVAELLGAEPKYTEGVISSLSGPSNEATLMQVSVPVQPGSSGGPLLNEAGDVVGIITASAAVRAFMSLTGTLPQSVNWAIKAEYARPLYDPPSGADVRQTRGEAINRAKAAICRVSAEIPVQDLPVALSAEEWRGNAINFSGGGSATIDLRLEIEGRVVSGHVEIGWPLSGSGDLRGGIYGDSIRFRSIGEGYVIDWEGRLADSEIQGSYIVMNTWPKQYGRWSAWAR